MELAQWQKLIVTVLREPCAGRLELTHVTHLEVLPREEGARDGEMARFDGILESGDLGAQDRGTFGLDLRFDLVAREVEAEVRREGSGDGNLHRHVPVDMVAKLGGEVEEGRHSEGPGLQYLRAIGGHRVMFGDGASGG